MYGITLTLPNGIPLAESVLPRVAYALERLAVLGETQWIEYAKGRPLPNGGRITPRSGAYLNAIRRTSDGPFSHEIFNDAPYADAIERGTGERDLKRMLDSSLKVRVTKDGRRYLIIPIRWGTGTGSGAGVSFGRHVMPPDAHATAHMLDPSRITGHGRRLSGTGAWSVRTQGPYTVRSRQYQWGGRLTEQALRAAMPNLEDEHVQRMRGMVKMQHPTRGGGKDTQYLTFRTMIEGGSGWRALEQAGKYPARAVAQDLSRIAGRVLREAVRSEQQSALSAT